MKKEYKKVILIEDNEAEAGLMKIVFKELNIQNELLHFKDGSELISQIPNISVNQIAYLLLDLNMPKINGFQLLKIFADHDEWRTMPVIVFSSSVNQTDINACYEMGANAYVSKPIDFNELSEVIKTIHAFWGEINTRFYR